MIKNITKLQERIFILITIISYVLYFTIAFGFLSSSTTKYLTELDKYMKIYVSLFLIWRFNPFRKVEFNELDRRIAYTAGIFLFTTTIINQILINYLKNLKSKIQFNYLSSVVSN